MDTALAQVRVYSILLNQNQTFAHYKTENSLASLREIGMGRESLKNRELRELAQLLRQVAFHRTEIDRIWQKVDALQTKMALPKKRRRAT